MARWQLTEAHYLNVPGTITEDRTLGENKKKKLPVPMHLDPNQESDWNYKEMIAPNVVEGKIIVCHEGKGEPRDIIFVGEPTPGMLPIDDEAKEISSKYNWTPTASLEREDQMNSFANKLLLGLMDDLSEAKKQAQTMQPVPGMAELMSSLSDMMKMQTQLLAALTGKNIPVPQEHKEERSFEEQATALGLEPPPPAGPPLPRTAAPATRRV